MLKGLFGSPAYEVYGKMIVDKAWEGRGATAVIGLKDADLALEAAVAADMPLPSAHIWRDYLAAAVDRGEGHLDWAVMALQQARASGLENSMPIIEPGREELKHLKGIHLWHSGMSNCSQRCRITLAEFKLEFESHLVSPQKGEHATAEFHQINPNGVVPALIHDGTLIIESTDIIDYLDVTFGNSALRTLKLQLRNPCKTPANLSLP